MGVDPARDSSRNLATLQDEELMALVLRHLVGIQRTLAESPTRFRPLLYMPDEKARNDKTPPEASAWCEGYMAGVKLRDDEWQPLYDAQDARDWIFPIEALAFGDQDPEFAEWIDVFFIDAIGLSGWTVWIRSPQPAPSRPPAATLVRRERQSQPRDRDHQRHERHRLPRP